MKKIAIIGAGGINSYVAQHLFDVCKLHEKDSLIYVKIFDSDIVEEKNIWRKNQNFEVDDLMSLKAEVLAKRYNFDFEPIFITNENIIEKLSMFDDIIIGVDNHQTRKLIYEFALNNKKWLLDLRANGTRTAYFLYNFSMLTDAQRITQWNSIMEKHFSNEEIMNRKGSCQLQEDIEKDHIESGNRCIAYYAIWAIYLKRLRNEEPEKYEFRDIY